MITFAFGLVHGFGFSFALRQTLQFAGAHLLSSLLSFNVGVEIGQLLVLVVLLPALALLFRYVVVEKLGIILLSALVAHTAWHWMQDRASALSGFSWPALRRRDCRLGRSRADGGAGPLRGLARRRRPPAPERPRGHRVRHAADDQGMRK